MYEIFDILVLNRQQGKERDEIESQIISCMYNISIKDKSELYRENLLFSLNLSILTGKIKRLICDKNLIHKFPSKSPLKLITVNVDPKLIIKVKY